MNIRELEEKYFSFVELEYYEKKRKMNFKLSLDDFKVHETFSLIGFGKFLRVNSLEGKILSLLERRLISKNFHGEKVSNILYTKRKLYVTSMWETWIENKRKKKFKTYIGSPEKDVIRKEIKLYLADYGDNISEEKVLDFRKRLIVLGYEKSLHPEDIRENARLINKHKTDQKGAILKELEGKTVGEQIEFLSMLFDHYQNNLEVKEWIGEQLNGLRNISR